MKIVDDKKIQVAIDTIVEAIEYKKKKVEPDPPKKRRYVYKMPHIPEEKLEMYRNVVKDALLPESTLQTVGDAYGISRERVRQIVNKATDYAKTRDRLRDSAKVPCIMCGKAVDASRKRLTKKGSEVYCGTHCKKLAHKFDLTTLLTCDSSNCENRYHPFRNHKHYDEKYGEDRARYCSSLCYFDSKGIVTYEKRRLYMREFLTNDEKTELKKAQEVVAKLYSRTYYRCNRDKGKEKFKKYYYKNREKILQKDKERYLQKRKSKES